MNALQLCRWQFSHKETLLQTFFKRSSIIEEKQPFCVLSLPLGNLGATYGDYLRLVGKRVGDFLLVLIELFSLCRTAEALRAIIGSKSTGAGWPKISGKRGCPPNPPQKTRLNDLSHGIKIWTDFSSVLSQSTRLIDRPTDGQTDKSDRQTDRLLVARPRLESALHAAPRGRNREFTVTASVLRIY